MSLKKIKPWHIAWFFVICFFAGFTYGVIKARIQDNKEYEIACKEIGGIYVFNGKHSECLKGSK